MSRRTVPGVCSKCRRQKKPGEFYFRNKFTRERFAHCIECHKEIVTIRRRKRLAEGL